MNQQAGAWSSAVAVLYVKCNPAMSHFVFGPDLNAADGTRQIIAVGKYCL